MLVPTPIIGKHVNDDSAVHCVRSAADGEKRAMRELSEVKKPNPIKEMTALPVMAVLTRCKLLTKRLFTEYASVNEPTNPLPNPAVKDKTRLPELALCEGRHVEDVSEVHAVAWVLVPPILPAGVNGDNAKLDPSKVSTDDPVDIPLKVVVVLTDGLSTEIDHEKLPWRWSPEVNDTREVAAVV